MLFSFQKLKHLAKLPAATTLQAVCDAINAIGFEVEGTSSTLRVSGVKYGKVMQTYKNPNADNLTVCEIEFADANRIIQTTATNVEAGKYLIAFIPGSKLKDLTFGEKKLKGIISQGMLASLEELIGDQTLVRSQ